MARIPIIFIVLLSSLVGCAEYAEREVREKFDIPIYKAVSVENIEEAVINKIPIGMEESVIYETLESINIGEDESSSYYKADKNREIVVRIEYDPNEPGLVKKHYGIVIKLDSDRKLESVKAHEWLTGL